MTSSTLTGPAGRVTVPRADATVDEQSLVTTTVGRRVLAIGRLATGFIFLWAFLDKTFGLGFSTPSAGAWIHGGKPASGFLLSPGVTGPLKGFFAGLAVPVVDGLFMIAMLGLGLAVMLGVGLRVSAVVGTALMLLMYLAEWPFTANAASTNPLVDYHLIYALSLILIAVLAAGDTWGFGRQWKSLPIVRRQRWLI
jgi:thiosulfate dehydrogenase [quinone] large subunit